MCPYLDSKGISQHCSQEDFTRIIREMVVQEWLTDFQENQGFLTESTVENEAPKFLQQGHYYGELANSMILAISNALENNSALHPPVLYIAPRSLKVTRHHRPGHHSGVSTCRNDTDAVPSSCQSHKLKCHCGLNSKGESSYNHCIPTEVLYIHPMSLLMFRDRVCNSM